VARRALESLLKTGRIVRGYLGVTMVNLSRLTPEARESLGFHDKEGVVVAQVWQDSPAEKAGIKPGDLIRRFNGRAVPDTIFFRSRVAELDVNSKVELTIVRGGQELTLTVQIVEAPPNLDTRPVQIPR
jgi:S1-C subfamily serine protease